MMLIVPMLAASAAPYRPIATDDLGPLVGDWLLYQTVGGERVIREDCDAADVPGVRFERGGSGFRVVALDRFEVTTWHVVHVRHEGDRWRIAVQGFDGTPNTLLLAVSGTVAEATWLGAEPMQVASPSAGFPKVEAPDCD